jgi:hypothetical protein
MQPQLDMIFEDSNWLSRPERLSVRTQTIIEEPE